MKEKIGIFLIFLLVITGCGKNPEISSKESIDSIAEEELLLDLSDLQAICERDNSLDAYRYCGRVSMNIQSTDEFVMLPTKWSIASEGAMRYQQFFSEEEGKGETFFLTASGEEEKARLFDDNQIPNLVSYRAISPIWGTGHFLSSTHVEENEKYSYYFLELDENLDEVNRITLPYFVNNKEYEIMNLMRDSLENVHILIGEIKDVDGRRMIDNSTYQYLVVSKEGEVLASIPNTEEYILDFIYLEGGQVAYIYQEHEEKVQNNIAVLDLQSGKPRKLGGIVKYTIDSGQPEVFSGITMLAENTLLYANKIGVYQRNMETEEDILLYRWSNHGIKATEVMEMIAHDGLIELIVQEGQQYTYLCLESVTEKEEMLSIEFVCSEIMEKRYRNMIADFNRKYPNCHIELVTDLDPTVLQTRLTAGEGPVLIDSGLTGFEDMKKLWMPLDGYIEQLVSSDEIIEKALECGKIDGKLYGLIDNYFISTVIIEDRSILSWDYEAFLTYVEQNKEKEYITNNDGPDGAEGMFINRFFVHGLSDNVFWNSEKERYEFRTNSVERLLDLMDQYYPAKEPVAWGNSLKNGKTLCNYVSLTSPSDVALHRILYGDKRNYVGYPHENGSGSYLMSSSPLCIRNSATTEEKKMALAFLKLMLSYDSQLEASEDINFHFSVRKDVCKEQFQKVTGDVMVYIPEEESIPIGDRLDNDSDYRTFCELVEKSTAYKYLPRELNTILTEEFQRYFAGDIKRKELLGNLEKRVNLYWSEVN